jgi:hypothetical protein
VQYHCDWGDLHIRFVCLFSDWLSNMTTINPFMILNFGLLLSELCFSKAFIPNEYSFCFYFLQTKAEIERIAASAREGHHHLSPGSVLEASFSSSSLDESPGKRA